jgi:hypothetical protein
VVVPVDRRCGRAIVLLPGLGPDCAADLVAEVAAGQFAVLEVDAAIAA